MAKLKNCAVCGNSIDKEETIWVPGVPRVCSKCYTNFNALKRREVKVADITFPDTPQEIVNAYYEIENRELLKKEKERKERERIDSFVKENTAKMRKAEELNKARRNPIEYYGAQSLTSDEILFLIDVSEDKDFISAMDKLKSKDIIEFTLKMSQLKQTIIHTEQQKTESTPQPAPNRPHCPTCGSADVEPISLGSKAIGGYLFGVFSSNIRNTYKCNTCKYKW